jgi:hypothetical protein
MGGASKTTPVAGALITLSWILRAAIKRADPSYKPLKGMHASLLVYEMVDVIEPYHTDEDEVDSDEVVQQARDYRPLNHDFDLLHSKASRSRTVILQAKHKCDLSNP